MLSIFPELLNYPLVAVTVLRVTTGLFFFMFGARLLATIHRIEHARIRMVGDVFAVLQCAVGLLLIAGLFTQPAALAGAVLALVSFEVGIGRGTGTSAKHVQLLLFVLCGGLVFLGPGLFAVDLPL